MPDSHASGRNVFLDGRFSVIDVTGDVLLLFAGILTTFCVFCCAFSFIFQTGFCAGLYLFPWGFQRFLPWFRGFFLISL